MVQKVDFPHSQSLCSQNRLPAHDSHKLSMTCAANFTFLAGWTILAALGYFSRDRAGADGLAANLSLIAFTQKGLDESWKLSPIQSLVGSGVLLDCLSTPW